MAKHLESATASEPPSTLPTHHQPVIRSAVTSSLAGSLPTFRWIVCGLLFFATTINYVDRQVIGILATPLQKELGWSESDYGWIITAFQAAYAVSMVLSGRLIDRVGTRIGYALGIGVWSLAAMAHGLMRSAVGFGVARSALGLGEATNFPAAIKTVAEWFPKRERAFATGLFNSGSNIGAVIAPLLVPFIAVRWGWRWAFYLTGAAGFVWLALWWIFYRKPEYPSDEDTDLHSISTTLSVDASPVSWRTLLRMNETWALGAARFVSDPIWWFYLFWIPKFLHAHHGVVLAQLGPPLIAIYLAADIGSVAGGYLSSSLIRRGWSPVPARKCAMLASAIAVVPMIFATEIPNLWATVALVALAAAAHQGWSANVFTIVSDIYPTRTVASMVGLCGFFGAVGGVVFSAGTGMVLQRTGRYSPMFFTAGIAYLVALSIIHAATRRKIKGEVT